MVVYFFFFFKQVSGSMFRRIIPKFGKKSLSQNKTAHLYVYTNEKSGMDGYDVELQRTVIDEMANGHHRERALAMDGKVDEQIKIMKQKIKKATKADKKKALEESDKMQQTIESERVSGEWCVVVDMDMYYAAIEQRDHCRLRGKPFAVGNKGIVATASYVARKYGVRSAMPGHIARALVSRQGGKLIFIQARMKVYSDEAKIINEVLSKYGPRNIRSLDEVYVNITKRVCKVAEKELISQSKAANQIVLEMRNAVFQKTKLTASAGCGPNLLLAKIAADMNKPDGQFVTPSSRSKVIKFMGEQPIRKIPGVGKVFEKKLKSLDIHTASDIIDKKQQIVIAFGKSKRSYSLLKSSLGVAETTFENKDAKTSSCETSFRPTSNRKTIKRYVSSLSDKALEKIDKKHSPTSFVFIAMEHNYTPTTTTVHADEVLTNEIILREVSKILDDSDINTEYRLIGIRILLGDTRATKDKTKPTTSTKKKLKA